MLPLLGCRRAYAGAYFFRARNANTIEAAPASNSMFVDGSGTALISPVWNTEVFSMLGFLGSGIEYAM